MKRDLTVLVQRKTVSETSQTKPGYSKAQYETKSKALMLCGKMMKKGP